MIEDTRFLVLSKASGARHLGRHHRQDGSHPAGLATGSSGSIGSLAVGFGRLSQRNPEYRRPKPHISNQKTVLRDNVCFLIWINALAPTRSYEFPAPGFAVASGALSVCHDGSALPAGFDPMVTKGWDWPDLSH